MKLLFQVQTGKYVCVCLCACVPNGSVKIHFLLCVLSKKKLEQQWSDSKESRWHTEGLTGG